MSRRAVVAVAVVVLLAGGAATAVLQASRPDDVFYVCTDLAALPLIGAAVIAACVTLPFWYRGRRTDQLRRERIEAAHAATKTARDDRLRFIRRLDHELKNPLTAMRAAAANVAGEPDAALV